MRKLNNTSRILAIGLLAALASGTALAQESPSMVHQVGHSLERAGTATGHFLKRGVEATAHGVQVGVNAISHGLKRVGDAVDHGTHEAADKLHAVLNG
ncbi:MAG: hypothetical protein KGL68_14830 [Burkholderiales bacterium]|nr:hypothetical protein [Burkholderiales bacterium]